MNTKAVKSFGLALMLAAGVLAVLLALGTFSPQKAGAQISGDNATVQPLTAPGGAATPIKVNFGVGTSGIISGQSITVTLAKFGVPAEIDPANVTIRTVTGTDTVRGNPSSVVTDPKKGTITVELGVDSDGLPMDITNTSAATSSITFAKAAGITAPTASGEYPVSVTAGGVTATTATGAASFTVSRSIKLDPEAGDKNTVITLTGVGFGDGTAKVYVLDATAGSTPPADTVETIATPTVSGGAFSVDIKIKVGTGDNEFANGEDNFVVVVGPREGGEGTSPGDHIVEDQFNLNGEVTVKGGNALILGTTNIEVTLEDGTTTATVGNVTIGGVEVPFAPKAAAGATQAALNVNGGGAAEDGSDTATERAIGDDGEITILISAPATLKEGSDIDLALVVDADTTPVVTLGSTKVSVNALALAMSPTTVIQGNDVTLTAGGFGSGEVASLEIRGSVETEDVDEIDSAVGKENVAGNYAFQFEVPDLPPGKATVTLTQDNGQVGKGTLTVQAPAITIDPSDGRIGSTVAVEGEGFPSRSAVHVTYGGLTDNVLTVAKTVTVVIADANGEWSTRFAVPGDAVRGSVGNKVQAFRPELDDDNLQRQSNVEKHVVPQPGTTVTPRRRSGRRHHYGRRYGPCTRRVRCGQDRRIPRQRYGVGHRWRRRLLRRLRDTRPRPAVPGGDRRGKRRTGQDPDHRDPAA